MSLLLIDGGNTAAKWELYNLTSYELLSEGVIYYATADFSEPWHDVTLVYVADVSERLVSKLKEQLKGVEIIEVSSQHSLLGVTNAYSEPKRLGVDRFLSVVEAYNRTNQACCVIDIGTAAKVDVVNDFGNHLGGYIVPGLDMSEHALLQGTGKVRFEPEELGGPALGYGISTAEAVGHGCLFMMVSWVERVAEEFMVAFPNGQVLLTGGSAELLVKHMQHDVVRVDGLVLSALLRIAKQAQD